MPRYKTGQHASRTGLSKSKKKTPAKKTPAKKTPTKKKSYLVKDVDAAYREVQGKMRKLAVEVKKTNVGDLPPPGPPGELPPWRKHEQSKDYANYARISAGAKKDRLDLKAKAMKMREARTKAISAAAKKHGVPKTEITKRKPMNPGEMLSKKVHAGRKERLMGTNKIFPRPEPRGRRALKL